MLREIVRPDKLEYINKEVEILVLPLDDSHGIDVKSKKENLRKAFGILKGKKIDPVEWQKELRDEWEERF